MLIRTIINLTFINDNILVSYFFQDTETQNTQDTQDTQDTQETEIPDNETIRAFLLSYFGSPENYLESPLYTTDLRSIIIPFKTQKNVLSIEQVDNLEKCELDISCPICMEDKSDNIKLNCQHIFCKDCIKTWLSKQSDTCPICRVTIQ